MMPIPPLATTQGNGLPSLPIVPLRFPLPHEFLHLSQLGMQLPNPRFHQGQMTTRLPSLVSIFQPMMPPPPPPPPAPPASVPVSIPVPVSRQAPSCQKSSVCSNSRNSASQHTPPFHRFTALIAESPGTRQTSPLHGSSVTISENHVTRQTPTMHISPACTLSGNPVSRHAPPLHRSLVFPSSGNSHHTPPLQRTWVCTNQSVPLTPQTPIHPGSLAFQSSKIGAHRPFTLLPGVTLEKDLPKHIVERLLLKGKAEVLLENGKRVRSDVWLYMGRIKLHDCGLFVNNYVACIGCKSVYPYRTKSQGTSTLRHHKCDKVFEVMKIKAARDAVTKLEEERKHQQKKQNVFKNQQLLPNIRLPVPEGLTVTLVQDIRCPLRPFRHVVRPGCL